MLQPSTSSRDVDPVAECGSATWSHECAHCDDSSAATLVANNTTREQPCVFGDVDDTPMGRPYSDRFRSDDGSIAACF